MAASDDISDMSLRLGLDNVHPSRASSEQRVQVWMGSVENKGCRSEPYVGKDRDDTF
jgi:hypothetical protein